MSPQIIRDILDAVIWLGWAFLLLTGLEADRPMSGGIPGHMDGSETAGDAAEGRLGRLGHIGSWVMFLGVAGTLPLVLWWILRLHRG